MQLILLIAECVGLGMVFIDVKHQNYHIFTAARAALFRRPEFFLWSWSDFAKLWMVRHSATCPNGFQTGVACDCIPKSLFPLSFLIVQLLCQIGLISCMSRIPTCILCDVERYDARSSKRFSDPYKPFYMFKINQHIFLPSTYVCRHSSECLGKDS